MNGSGYVAFFDFLKIKKAPTTPPVAKKTPKGQKAAGTYTRRVKIENTAACNNDGTSRQKVLSDIYHKKPPFDKVLNLEMTEYEQEGNLAYLISVNGIPVGDAASDMVAFISSSKERLLGINDFKVFWESPLEEEFSEAFDNGDFGDPENVDYYKLCEKKIKEKDRTYFAKMKILVRSKNK